MTTLQFGPCRRERNEGAFAGQWNYAQSATAIDVRRARRRRSGIACRDPDSDRSEPMDIDACRGALVAPHRAASAGSRIVGSRQGGRMMSSHAIGVVAVVIAATLTSAVPAPDQAVGRRMARITFEHPTWVADTQLVGTTSSRTTTDEWRGGSRARSCTGQRRGMRWWCPSIASRASAGSRAALSPGAAFVTGALTDVHNNNRLGFAEPPGVRSARPRRTRRSDDVRWAAGSIDRGRHRVQQIIRIEWLRDHAHRVQRIRVARRVVFASHQ
jgi:hypothetical protein